MENKTVIVTGAHGNLGSAVVQEFLKQGQKVVGFARGNHEESENPFYQTLETDLLKEDESAKSVAIAINRVGEIDTAVLTAGGFTLGTIASTTAPDLEKLFMLNFETAYNVAKPTLKHMSENGKGKIFFIGSGVGMDTRKGNGTVAYSLSKSLLFQLANIINADIDKTGVQAHVIVPGTIDTPQNRESMPNADFSQWEKPEDIARIIYDYSQKTNNIDETILLIKEILTKN